MLNRVFNGVLRWRLFIACLFTLCLSVHALAQTRARVVGVKDGDTITALLDGNVQVTLRLAEVDCPEKKQPYGQKAKAYTSSQVFGKYITFVKTSTDRNKRIIAKVYYDGNKYLSAQIIRAGYGWWFYQYSKDASLGRLQQQAMAARAGLFADKNAMAPWQWRKLKRAHQVVPLEAAM